MNIAEAAIRYKVVTLVISLLLIGAGILYYDKLGRLEDPEFTIKDAQVITYYPGATPKEVEEEVTDTLETAIQELGQLDEIVSESKAGVSTITVTIKDKYDKKTLPQVWDELRRKVNDAQSQLPPGTLPSIVYDDFGDVFGVLLAIEGKGFSYQELKDVSDFLKREILLVDDVAKVTTWGEQQQQIFVEISRAKMAQLGISLNKIYNTLARKNLVAESGAVRAGKEYIRIQPTGELDSLSAIKNLVISGTASDKLIYLKNIANIYRSYVTPPKKHLRINGEPAVALGISTISGGNVVKMGEAIAAKLKILKPQIPLGIQLTPIYYQGEIVAKSVNGFVINLIEALVIVIVVLMIFMGMRSGMIIGGILLLTVCSTIALMYFFGINLQRISLGALIISLGMLVDNAIVVVEGMLIRIQQGVNAVKAASQVVAQTMWPLLGATIIAVLAFAAIGVSQDSTGEYLRSLFQVILIALGMSWVTAVTVTPLCCTMLLKTQLQAEAADPYKGLFFQLYKGFLSTCIRFRWLTVAALVGLLSLAVIGFNQLEDSFFPDSTSKQFMVNYFLPQGTDIRQTSSDVKTIEKNIMDMKGVTSVASFVGSGAPRFMLVYSPEKADGSYAFLLVEVDDYKKIDALSEKIRSYLVTTFPDSNPKIEKIRLGPGGGFPIEVRFIGDKPEVLRQLAAKAKAIMRADGHMQGIRDDWRERVKLIQPQLSSDKAQRVGMTRADVARSLQTNFSGTQVGVYREGDELIPIVSIAPVYERSSAGDLISAQVWTPIFQRVVPLRQVIDDIKTYWEDAIIHRDNKRRTITVQAEQISGNASVVFKRIRHQIENIPLPVGYQMEWGGEYENSLEARQGLAANIPATFIIMVLVTIALFNGLRQPLIIWLTVPLAIIGVTIGLLITNESFGFMALLGFLSLSGMLIKNAIVLLDEIECQIADGKPPYQGIIDAAVSRMRPVSMAAVTTILGMIPLLTDVFFFGMAITIIFGLAFATLLTLIVVPVLYAIFYKVAYHA